MPKRECPFEDNLTPQLKVHVGQRQLNNGANKEQEMKKVYERTLSLLRKGSKEFGQKLSLCADTAKDAISPEKPLNDSKHKSPLKQMIIDSKMKLRPTDKEIDPLTQESCETCRTTAVLAYSRCFYCNNFKCIDCMEECIKCQEHFCDKCSLIVYEDGEHTECLACYGQSKPS